MTDLEKAINMLSEEAYTCVLCKDGEIYTSHKSGIAPMLDFLSDKTPLNGFSAADKIIGKAAAMLFVLAGVSKVYGEVMCAAAIPVFEKYGISYEYKMLTPVIMNRTGEGMCPMEDAVKDIESPSQAEKAIRERLKQLSRG